MASPIDKAKGDLSAFERQALDTILELDHPILEVLRQQLGLCRVTEREFTGVGFFTSLTVPPDAPRAGGDATFSVSGADADLEGLARGAGFHLFITNGILDYLEAHTYDEPWPDTMGEYTIRRFELNDARTLRELDDV
jgi:hypothetical protein